MSRAISLLFALLIAGFAAGAASTANSAAGSRTIDARPDDIESDDIDVPLPKFPYEDYLLQRHETSRDDHDSYSGNRMPLTVQLLRARNLLAAGHYEEAIADYKEGLPQWKVPSSFQRSANEGYALACEKVGKIDEAIALAKIVGDNELLAKLYLKERRFAEAKSIADNKVIESRMDDFKHHQSYDLAPWLQLRALAECHLKQYENAVRDLKDAARRYYQEDSEAANVCVRAANAISERYKLGGPFKLDASQLPAKGKEKVIALVKFLSTSSNALAASELDRLTGTHIKIPNKSWEETYQEEREIRPFDDFEYRVEDDNLKVPELVMLRIATDECCVPKAEIDALFPSNGSKVRAVDRWSGSDDSQYAEAWKLPTGRLFLRFGEGGARVLDKVEFDARGQDEVSAAQLARWAYSEGKEQKVTTLTDAIKLDDQMVDLYIQRAHAYCDIGKFQEALADAKHAVALGGRFYLNQQSLVEEKMGNLDAAIEHYKQYVGDQIPGPETAAVYTRLAELYVENKNYEAALESVGKAFIDSSDRSAALFVKAKAEAGVGNLTDARIDAKSAADGYFDKAEIVLRDPVLEWLKTLPQAN